MTGKVKYQEGTVKPEHVKDNPKYNMHENSLKNLKPKWDKEHMQKMAQKSVETRRANKEAREQMKMTISIFKDITDGLVDEIPNGLTVIKMSMMKAIQDNDMIEAARLATILAEYEQPKLQRTENINANLDFKDITDAELEEQLALLNGKNTKVIEHQEE